jgi:hypothetical protein
MARVLFYGSFVSAFLFAMALMASQVGHDTKPQRFHRQAVVMTAVTAR